MEVTVKMNESQRIAMAKQVRESGFLADIVAEVDQFYYNEWRKARGEDRERIGIAHDILDDVVAQIMGYALEGKLESLPPAKDPETAGDS